MGKTHTVGVTQLAKDTAGVKVTLLVISSHIVVKTHTVGVIIIFGKTYSGVSTDDVRPLHEYLSTK